MAITQQGTILHRALNVAVVILIDVIVYKFCGLS